MTLTEIKNEIISIIAESTETEVPITENTHIVNEIGLSSIETMMLVTDLEDRFGIVIPTSGLRNVRTVADLCQLVIDELS